MVICPKCSVGSFLKTETSLPIFGFIKDVTVEILIFLALLGCFILGLPLFLVIAIMLFYHVSISWVKSNQGLQNEP